MKTYYKNNGRECFFLTSSEIDLMMEDELCKANLIPTIESPVVNIEAFIDKYLMVPLDQHAPLDQAVLGVTEFERNEKPKIKINKDLTGMMEEDDSNLGKIGRWRATLAHEASHVIIHGPQFALNLDQAMLPGLGFDNGFEKQNLLRCLKRNVSFRNVADEREIQANMGMASLLFPKSVFLKLAKRGIEKMKLARTELTLGSRDATALVAYLAEAFQASKQATAIRLGNLNIISEKNAVEMGV